ncbi:helix-turn-helix, type 11 domain-containing protein [Aciduliprofundum boonei T469]|uniref:Helix-turn-helix, type 11 domain-containing protein n=2 Tax=Candidatus Aciduliprofundum boonei TaxID=379547 RepID=D3TA37_ACIB4|nr:helix-turn-helix, type 11 domain-containing protein [Aciduliprofundum boonei T469]HII54720.1 DNA-binding protein [Candidatus Aciduliprofundum boonei]
MFASLSSSMGILRDKSKITEMMILLSILKGNKKLKEIASDVGITIQGVSEYSKLLESSGFLKNGKITPAGMEFLYASLKDIGDFVHEANKIIGKIKITEAIAGEDIKEGDKVGLFMENGYIYTYRKESSSMGIASMDAKKGEDLGVKNLRGIMNINYGDIKVYVMPQISDGGSRKVNKEKIKELIKKENRKIGVCGVVAYITIKDIAKIDFEFAAVNSAINAAYRGISTILFVSHEMLPYTLKILEDSDVRYEVSSVMDIQ